MSVVEQERNGKGHGWRGTKRRGPSSCCCEGAHQTSCCLIRLVRIQGVAVVLVILIVLMVVRQWCILWRKSCVAHTVLLSMMVLRFASFSSLFVATADRCIEDTTPACVAASSYVVACLLGGRTMKVVSVAIYATACLLGQAAGPLFDVSYRIVSPFSPRYFPMFQQH
jgi:hypothetical protein